MIYKSTVEEIRHRFDNDVERFSNLQTGQQAAMDSPLGMELCASLAATHHPKSVLDLGCGAGNYTLRLLQILEQPPEAITLNDLSLPMLERAESRIRESGYEGVVRPIAGDLREIELKEPVDVVLAAAVLHHLREESEWDQTFAKVYSWLNPGGGFYIYDMVCYENPAVQRTMDDRYAAYLTGIGGEEYRDKVLAYIAKEDTPRPVSWQLEKLRQAGFGTVDVVHANGPFAVYCAVRD